MTVAYKWTAWGVLAVFIASLAAPIAQAGDTIDYDTYSSQVYDDLAQKRALEQQYQEAQQRAKEYEKALQDLEARRKTASPSDQSWLQQEYDKVKGYFQSNDNILTRTKEKLTTVYNSLETRRQETMKSSDPRVNQLGDVIGAAGSASVVIGGREFGAFPTYMRPTAGEVGASLGQVGRQVRVSTINARIGADGTGGLYNKAANALGNAATANAQAAATIKGTEWVAVQTNQYGGTTLRPRLPDGTFGSGSIQVPKSLKPGTAPFNEYVNTQLSLKNSAWNITKELNQAQHQLRSTADAKGQEILQKRVEVLSGKKAQIESDIAKFEQDTPEYAKPKSQLKTMAVSAAKWAAVSCAITVGANVIQQMSSNGWDPSKVNWSAATADLRTPQFWGGVGGSFLGSWGASMIAGALPGGPFVKALAAVGGAALGWQIGSGNLKNTDWTMLGVTTVTSTIGMLVGQAIFPFLPGLGAIIGGIVGHWAGTKLLGWIRDKLQSPVLAAADKPESYDYSGGYSSPGYSQDTGGYNGTSPVTSGGYGDSPTGSSGSVDSSQVASIKVERDKAYKEWLAAQQNPGVSPAELQALHQAYVQRTQELRDAQRSASFSDYGR